MSLREAMQDALDKHDGDGPVQADAKSASVEIDATDIGPIGVRVRQIRVKTDPLEITDAARALPERLRALGEPVVPVEVAPKLGGTTLRTAPDDMRSGEFFDVDVKADGRHTISRHRVTEDGRKPIEWAMTRDQLGRLLDDLTESG